ncbi:hypothetical protein BKA61DRAFT_672832 [Leptodontidium sp. MPI-SDFR-AT-0119]|nr:hypothetical protein BKA61DRAFT_672832 [Leptodontidium sp. MPI-SDFR-AT-0119]
MHQDGTTEEEVNHKDILREAMGTKLAALIPTVDAGMNDLKTEVEKMQHPLTETLQNAVTDNFGSNYRISCPLG